MGSDWLLVGKGSLSIPHPVNVWPLHPVPVSRFQKLAIFLLNIYSINFITQNISCIQLFFTQVSRLELQCSWIKYCFR